MEIALIDSNECSIGGHNYIYRKILNRIDKTIIIEDSQDFKQISENPIKAFKGRLDYINRIPKKEIMHFLHLDIFYMFPHLFKKLKLKKIKIIGTLHWYPNKKIKSYLLKRSSKYIDIIVVHSEYIKDKLNDLGIFNVEVIDYPSFYPEHISINKNIINKDKSYIKILCIGATRFDKGIDIVSRSFQYINHDSKKCLKFLFAGRELDNAYDLPKKLANQYGINLEIVDKRLTDEEYWEYIDYCDVILLPYRKIFTGNSGPMTDGIYMNKFILGPNQGNLGFLINKHSLGLTFEQENHKDLADKISKLPNINLKKNHEYSEELSVEKFLEKYRIVYRGIEERVSK